MKASSLLAGSLLSGLLALACAPGGVGDPCEPVSCPADTEDTGFRCGWQKEEIYLEGRSLQCRTRVCMVFRIDKHYQDPDLDLPGPYCTRPCGPGAAYEECPGDYCCMQIVTEEQASGYYCVKKKDLTNSWSGDTERMARDCELIHQCYKSGVIEANVSGYIPQECHEYRQQ